MKRTKPIVSASIFTILFFVSTILYYILLRWRNECWYFLYAMIGGMPLIFGSMAVATVLTKGKKLPWYFKIPLSILAFAVVGCIPIGGYYYFDRKVFGQSNYHQLAVLMTSVSAAIYATLLFIYCRGSIFTKAKADKIVYAAVVAVCVFGIILGSVGAPLYTPIYRFFNGTDMGGTGIQNTSIKYAFDLTTQKYTQSSDLGDKSEMDIALAKNEWESFQLLLAAPEKAETVYVEVTDFVNSSGETMETAVYYADYIHIPYRATMNDTHFYPDALIPLESGKALTIQKGCNQTFVVETQSTTDTMAGDYTATVTVKSGSGTVILQKEVQATVWDFTLPEGHYSETAVGLDCSMSQIEIGIDAPTSVPGIPGGYGITYGYNTWLSFYDGSIDLRAYPEVEALYKAYYDYLLDRGLCANFLPYDILDDPRAEEYMDDPRVTSFCVPYPWGDDVRLVAYWNKVNEKAEWAAKAYFYPVDEPFDSSRMSNYDTIVERLERLCPGARLVTPFNEPSKTDGSTGEYLAIFEKQLKHNQILCPISDMYSDAIYYLFYPGFADTMKSAVSEGKDSWWYVCSGPNDSSGMCNVYIHQPAIKPRMLFWQQYDHDVTGFLYYFTNAWTGDPYVSPRTAGACNSSGDGSLLYPGATVGVEGPVGSIRLINLTAGLEDYDYLKLAEEAFGKEWVDETVARLTTSVSKYTKDCDLMEAVRREIGEKLSGQ